MDKKKIKERVLINIYIVLCLVVFNACSDITTLSEENLSQSNDSFILNVHNNQVSYDEFMKRANRLNFMLDEQIPRFGGVFFEENGSRLVIYTTDLINLNEIGVKNEVRKILSTEAPDIGKTIEGGLEALEIRFEEANYKYTELYAWRDQIMSRVLDSKGVTFISVSDKNNKIRIGIESEQAENQVFNVINTFDVPKEAIKISVTGPIIDHQTLRDMVRPLTGGTENRVYFSSGNPVHLGPCTYGFNAYKNGNRYWVTNSHCTRARWSVNPNDEYYQASIADGSSAFVGNEYYDPQGFTSGPGCSSSVPCRWSDAALIELPSSATWDFATLARTDIFNPNPVVINPNNPRISLGGQYNNHIVGRPMSKVGRTTGRTSGPITESCAHLNHFDGNIGSFRYLCQVIATYDAGGGDSGSPVYISARTSSYLGGIHWGQFATGDMESIYSRMDGVQNDIGPIVIN